MVQMSAVFCSANLWSLGIQTSHAVNRTGNIYIVMLDYAWDQTLVWSVDTKQRNNIAHEGTDWRTILRQIWRKQGVGAWTESIWFANTVMNLHGPKIQEIFSSAAQLLA
jgi:hypothetical protein